MSTLEAALRGGAVFVLLLFVALLARNARRSRVSRYSALLLAGVAAYVVESAPGFGALDLRWRAPIHVLSTCTPAVFWITVAALFDDEFRARWYHALAWLALAVLGSWEMLSRLPSVVTVHYVLSLVFILLGIWHALAGRAADLVEGRRRLRVQFAVATALYTALIIALDWLWPGGLSAAPLSLANAIGLTALIFLFAVVRLSSPPEEQQEHDPEKWIPVFGKRSCSTDDMERDDDSKKSHLAPDSARGGSTQSPAGHLTAAPPPGGPDAVLLEALRKLMEHGRAYREEGLSIASLSQKLEVPEYRLRRLINRQLGHRNFSTFVNGYRLADAQTALADPGQADVPILTIALDAGFGSVGPFNRAFKAHTGLTPTEYRRRRPERSKGTG
jgi:AraC-like DNA-binding protein